MPAAEAGCRASRGVDSCFAAAQEVFVAQGYHGAAMDDIAERAGVSKPVLYQHFPGKLELYLALIDAHTDALVATIRNALAATDDNQERVHGVLAAYFDFVDGATGEWPGAFRLIFETDLGNEPAVRERVERADRAIMRAVSDTVSADTGLSRPQAELLAVALTGAAQVAARWWLDNDRPVSARCCREPDRIPAMARAFQFPASWRRDGS